MRWRERIAEASGATRLINDKRRRCYATRRDCRVDPLVDGGANDEKLRRQCTATHAGILQTGASHAYYTFRRIYLYRGAIFGACLLL